ncbi:MAG: GIY-YIG nuclease family protein [Clostridia bacterium]|nr:GIY-YIG nuclease family protein [Clostridia bacterium]
MADKHYTYLLLCSDNTLYCGYTTNPKEREKTHNSGTGAKYTRCRLPVKMVYCECSDTRSEAMKRECAIKKLSRNKKLELIQSDNNIINSI